MEALFYKKIKEERVECTLCAQHCVIRPGRRGKCGVRENREGTLYSLVYGRLIAQQVDPVEKKPLFHFQPGSLTWSIATAGCNFRCLFCQNSDISQSPREDGTIFGNHVSADEVVNQALRAGCSSISYTYTEPTIFMEFALDTARTARKAGLRNIFVSNGYMTEEALTAVAPYLDAANVDLKAFTDDFYREQCGAHLDPVLRTIERMKGLGIWVETTTLLIPGLNDSPAELREAASFLASVSPDIPWHVSRFHPTYRMTDRPPTPVETLRTARRIGIEAGLHYVYTGNIPGDDGEHTLCSECGALLLERFGFSVKHQELVDGHCAKCGRPVAGVDMK